MTAALPLRRLVAACALALACAHAHAGTDDDDTKARKLDPVVVKGNVLGGSNTQDVTHYAGSRQVIDRDQLAHGANRSLDDALQHVPGVKIFDETGTGVLPQIMLRGLYESRSGRVQVLEDGTPLSLAPYGQTSLSLFPVTLNQIDRIDIVRGGAAVQYGPNNVGGVINLVSKPIPETWTTTLGERITAGGAGRYLRDTSLSTGGYLTPDFGLQLDADWLKGRYWREHSDTDVKNLRLRAEWWLADDKLLKAQVQRYVAGMDLAGALSPDDYRADPRRATRPLDAFTGRTTRSALTYEQDLGAWGPFDQSQFSWRNFGAESARDFRFGTRLLSAENFRPDLPPQLDNDGPRHFSVYGTQPQLNLHVDSGAVTQQWTMGVRGEREDIDYFSQSTNLLTGVFLRDRDWGFSNRAGAAYVSDAIGLDSDRLTITPGVRYEYLNSTYHDRLHGTEFRNDIRNWLPGLTVGYKASDKWYVYADAQRSLRAPQVTAIVFGNALDSELAWNYEFGARFTPSQDVQISADLYRIDFDNQIIFDSTTRSYGNLGATRNQGLEASLRWHPAGWQALTLDAGYAYLDASQRAGAFQGNRVPYTSRNQFNLGAEYRADDATVVALNSYYFSKAFSDAPNTRQENAIASIGQLPAYWVWNAQLTHTFLRNERNTLTGTLAVNNLFDRHYWYRGIDTSPWGREPAPRRTATVGLELSF